MSIENEDDEEESEDPPSNNQQNNSAIKPKSLKSYNIIYNNNVHFRTKIKSGG